MANQTARSTAFRLPSDASAISEPHFWGAVLRNKPGITSRFTGWASQSLASSRRFAISLATPKLEVIPGPFLTPGAIALWGRGPGGHAQWAYALTIAHPVLRHAQ